MTAPSRRCAVCHVAYPGGERFCSIDGGAIVEDAPAGQVSRIGQTIDGRYLVRRFLGRGGMGEVYEADHVGLDKRVAIKFVTGDNTQKTALARFRREARVASRIVHEHVVHIYDVGADHGIDFIVMEYLEGKDLRDVLAADGKLAAPRAVAITRQMLAGLHAIHQAGILHRDIKPANVLLTTRGRDRDFVKIMDFGISKSVGTDEAGSSLTGTGNVIGTPQFIAPEMLRGAEVDHRADLYAVGITLYAMLAGDGPFPNTAFERMVAMHLTEIPRPLDELRTDLSPALVAAVARSLAKDPDERFADAQEFADALEADDLPAPRARGRTEPPATIAKARGEQPTIAGTARPAPRAAPEVAPDVPRARRLWPWALALVLVLLGGGAVGLILRGSGDADVVAPSDAPLLDAGTLYDETLAFARRMEAEDRLALAIDLYEEAVHLTPTPDTVFHIGELHERLGQKLEAAAAFRRYLELRPGAKDREIVSARIAALDPPLAIDAGVELPPDATVIRRDQNGRPIEPGPPDLACVCTAADPKLAAPLCMKRGPSGCKCEASIGNLCPATPIGCGPHDRDCEPTGFRCPSPGWRDYSQVGKHGAACAGFRVGPTAPGEQGTFRCRVCAKEDPHQFRGQPGARCLGYLPETGVEVPGTLDDCRPVTP